MINSRIERLIGEAEGAAQLDSAMLERAADVLRRVFPEADLPVAAPSDPVGQALHLVEAFLPTWTIRLTGNATGPDGHWHCSLRESPGSDEDELIGFGSGRVIGLAVVAALLRVARARAAH
ncbi:MAG: hypothetical protein IOC80_14910 [Rhodobacter sp.]|nr:hypothetical protein [Rhodobacter sp.]MCA3513229.1 hypothetical protein [Rhodobacter sp.]MCA3520227.1 hypothetical protein [Rhodobacter sp.]MCA3523605.1 hypothetical protein [Rhodobacter sp.]MCA3526152.1 hypothetical protein [Rhodobacter sp.]